MQSTTAFRSKVAKIGNSSGFRVPKHLLNAMSLDNGDIVDIYIVDGKLMISPVKHPRDGWAEAAKKMHKRGDDKLLDDYTPTDFDKDDWEWE